jgi:hypothetical protein
MPVGYAYRQAISLAAAGYWENAGHGLLIMSKGGERYDD